ncbi:hypothetical protein AJ79_08865 [Helicocarpus griseus UAMH5409]|uniref:Inositol polyphosphate-related phosphatase domain-containing protein n=1 Tax=Helicocarpus griseus UAMH5409 TaxID=1447875 RepID=A0A2B7WPA4_9EURO|nr:hypothetical protein AJ79_08865 [Helicocarpus griseus UAMH5409]
MAPARSILSACLLLPAFQQIAAAAAPAATGQFSFLTFNINGLPGISNGVPGKKSDNHKTMGSKFAQYGYDVIHVQEDFNYHDDLYGADNHPHRTETSGGLFKGDGLNTLANHPWEESTFSRSKWDECSDINAADCFTPKGFTAMTMELAPGVLIDFYNVHADASATEADLKARRDNIAQLAEFIQTNSADRPVVIGGDSNMLYTREAETVKILTDLDFVDPWVELIMNGTAPATGSSTPECENPAEGLECETLDKIFYRPSTAIDLQATYFNYETSKFLQEDGSILSDHNPVTTNFYWTQL